MKLTLIITLSLVAAALLFPFRTGVVTQSYGVVEVPMGPYFVASAPSKQDIAEAFLGKTFDDPDKVSNKHRASSHVDYGRTILLAGGAAALGLMAILIIVARHSLTRNAASLPVSSSQPAPQQERLA